MASTAISAQGSTFSIAGTDGTALTITAITKATSAVCSCTSPPAVGTTVVFSSATGMPEIVGRIGYVTSISAGVSFTVNIDSSNFAAAATAASAAPKTWSKVGNLKTFSGFDGAKSELDTSNLDSLAKEFIPGLEDFGQFSVEFDLDPADVGQLALRANKSANANTYFRLATPNGKVRAWAGFVKKLTENGGVDQIYKANADVRITGPVNLSERSS